MLLYIFYLWTFVLIARPQDFIVALEPLRPALSVSIVVIILYLFNHTRYKNKLLDNKQCRLFVYLLMIMIISIPFAYYRRGAFEFVFTKYIVTVLFFSLFYKIIDDTKKLQNVLWISCFGTSLYLLSALHKGEMVSGRLQFGQMFDPNDLAYFALSFLPFNFLFISKNNPLWQRLVCPINIVVCVMIILLTGSRGGFIALSVVVIMLFFEQTKIISKTYKIIITLAIITIVYGGSTIDFTRLETIRQIGEDYNVVDETGRLEIWKKGLGLMMNNPLTGVGVSCFSEAIGKERSERGLQERWQAPHNSLIEIGAETGILGLLFFVLISINTLRIFGRTKYTNDNEHMIRIGKISKIAFAGNFVSSMF